MTPDDRSISRRRALGVGAAAAAGAWVAPAIVTVDAASAQGSGPGAIAGTISYCSRAVDPSEIFDVAAEIAGVPQATTVSDVTGAYLLSGLVAGTYDVRLTPQGGGPDQLFTGISVTDGVTTTLDPDYQAGGC